MQLDVQMFIQRVREIAHKCNFHAIGSDIPLQPQNSPHVKLHESATSKQ